MFFFLFLNWLIFSKFCFSPSSTFSFYIPSIFFSCTSTLSCLSISFYIFSPRLCSTVLDIILLFSSFFFHIAFSMYSLEIIIFSFIFIDFFFIFQRLLSIISFLEISAYFYCYKYFSLNYYNSNKLYRQILDLKD